MITILVIILLALIFAIFALVATGIGIIFWPALLILGFGILIDVLTIRSIVKKRKV